MYENEKSIYSIFTLSYGVTVASFYITKKFI